jgi:RNA polymerase-associated protein
MAAIANRRSVMTLFSGPTDPFSHRTRLVLAEKGITFDVLDVEPGNPPEDLMDLNPSGAVPTLVDRSLVLDDSRVIMEYLDERFPHPPLMPVDPVARAEFRLTICHLDRDWYGLVPDLESGDDARAAEARKILRESVALSAKLFSENPFFRSDEFSLVDCSIVPILWRLPHFGIELPPQAKPVLDYAQRIFDRESFRMSLSEREREMRE